MAPTYSRVETRGIELALYVACSAGANTKRTSKRDIIRGAETLGALPTVRSLDIGVAVHHEDDSVTFQPLQTE